jgi:hypothetical protein
MLHKIFLNLLMILTLLLVPISMAMAMPWSQGFNESGVGKFDRIEVFIVDGNVDFTSPGQTDFSVNKWTAELINPKYSIASGKETTNLTWNINFTDNTPFTLDFFAFNKQGVQVESARASWNGSGWPITLVNQLSYSTDLKNNMTAASAVPIPPAVLLLGTGLGGLIFIRRKNMQI